MSIHMYAQRDCFCRQALNSPQGLAHRDDLVLLFIIVYLSFCPFEAGAAARAGAAQLLITIRGVLSLFLVLQPRAL